MVNLWRVFGRHSSAPGSLRCGRLIRSRSAKAAGPAFEAALERGDPAAPGSSGAAYFPVPVATSSRMFNATSVSLTPLGLDFMFDDQLVAWPRFTSMM